MFYPSIRASDYQFVSNYCRTSGIKRKDFLADALEWQIQNPDYPIQAMSSKVKTFTLTEKGPRITDALKILRGRHPDIAEQRLCLNCMANYLQEFKTTDKFDIDTSHITVGKKLTLTLSDEVVTWLKDSYGTVSSGIQTCIDLAHTVRELPPLDGNFRTTSKGGKATCVYLKESARDQIKDLIGWNGGSPNTVLRQSIQVARSTYDMF